ncbi:hypothetical protein BD626DRAFT_481785 [Schizophyllum amplum]|uniref:Uncharacterized protein n=1 Tax=Schizophyllum amplum TaxID=97359 RepID=A0A550CUJ3_9AGAR|nr:hypothetical protein BD626DRAFT_481785 [Auriculariopsis ampla]
MGALHMARTVSTVTDKQGSVSQRSMRFHAYQCHWQHRSPSRYRISVRWPFPTAMALCGAS